MVLNGEEVDETVVACPLPRFLQRDWENKETPQSGYSVPWKGIEPWASQNVAGFP
jgi:hypothetical protein